MDGSKTLTNRGENSIWISETLTGLPLGDPGAISEGYKVTKDIFSMDGIKLTNSNLTKGERAIIRVTIDPAQKRSAMIVLADLLPAGLEIETILTPEETAENAAYSFIGATSDLDLAEARDDRLVASERLNRWDDEDIRVAYIVRAVTEGDFVFPGAVAEDMYRPEIRGRTESGRLSISAIGSN